MVVVVDMAGTDGRKPWDDYRKVLAELSLLRSFPGRSPQAHRGQQNG